MCEQCLAKAVLVIKNIVPGYQLMQSTVETEHWPKDWYGVVESNDPLFVVQGPFVEDPYKNMTDEQINNSTKEMADADTQFINSSSKLDESLRLPLIDGYKFMHACIEAGYSYTEHGTNVAAWLNNHVAENIKWLAELNADSTLKTKI